MMRKFAAKVIAGFFATACLFALEPTRVVLSTQPPESVLVGQTIVWDASAAGEADMRYRFRVRRAGEEFRLIRDFGPLGSLTWSSLDEGLYEMEISARPAHSAEGTSLTRTLLVRSRVEDGHPAVAATSHPLVFIFSAPACPEGSEIRAVFEADGVVQTTPPVDCTGRSMNVYLAGLHAEKDYTAWAITQTGDGATASPLVTFRTGKLPAMRWSSKPGAVALTDPLQPILLATSLGSQAATDLTGEIIWFNPAPVSYFTRIDSGGYFWGLVEDVTQPAAFQSIRKLNLVGETVLETNAEEVNHQLEALGRPPINGFHHEIRTLPDGRIMTLAGTERWGTDVQGPGTVNIVGDMILVFDQNLRVVWTWNAFDHLDVTRMATQAEVCAVGDPGCPPLYQHPTANDWTHGNALALTPDGHILYSCRHQDWLIKIDYGAGSGSGQILWRLGKDGDFTYLSDDPYPWFSHQHDGSFDGGRLLVFDNANVRNAVLGGGNSRGQVIELDETARTAKLILNADLGVNAIAVGSAQRLRNGHYHFDAGFVLVPGGLAAHNVEVDSDGTVLGSLVSNALVYRSFRLSSLYGPE